MNATLKEIRKEFTHWLRSRLDKNPLLRKSFLPHRGHEGPNCLVFEIVPITARPDLNAKWDTSLGFILHTTTDQTVLGCVVQLGGVLFNERASLLDPSFEPIPWSRGLMRQGLKELSRRTLVEHPELATFVRLRLQARNRVVTGTTPRRI